MILRKLAIANFKVFRNRVVDFGEGLNIITGPNESGKSTIVTCLTGLFFVKPGAAAARDFGNWEGHAPVKGSLTYTGRDGSEYRLEKEFALGGKTLLYKNEERISDNEGRIQKVILEELGIPDQRVFENTCCLTQGDMLGITRTNMKIREKIMGLISGSQAKLSVEDALGALDEEIKIIEGKSHSPDMQIQKGALGCLEEERRELNDNLAKARKIENARANLKAIKRGIIEKNREIEDYSALLSGNARLKSLGEKKEEKRIEREKYTSSAGEMEKIERALKGMEKQRGMPFMFILLMLGMMLAVAGAVVVSFRKLPPLLAVCLLLAALALGGMFSVVYRMKRKHGREILLARKDAIAGSDDAEALKKKEGVLLEELYNIDREISSLQKCSLEPHQVLKYEGLLAAAKREYGDMNEARNTHEIEIKAFESVCSSDIASLLDELDGVEEGIRQFRQRMEACKIAMEVLEEARDEAQEVLAPSLETESEKVMSLVTGGKYAKMKIDARNLDISVYSELKNDFMSQQELSMGLSDQLYFSLRTVLSRILSSSRTVPLVLDDPFIYFDDARRKNAMDLIEKIAEQNQVLLLTCYEPRVKGMKNAHTIRL